MVPISRPTDSNLSGFRNDRHTSGGKRPITSELPRGFEVFDRTLQKLLQAMFDRGRQGVTSLATTFRPLPPRNVPMTSRNGTDLRNQQSKIVLFSQAPQVYFFLYI